MAPAALISTPRRGSGLAAPPTPGGDLRSIAIHEAAHICASRRLGRPVGEASVEESGGWVELSLLGPRSRADLGRVLVDITILTIGAEACGESLTGFGFDGTDDEARALDAAWRVAESPGEAAAIVRLGREQARTILGRPGFAERVERLADALMDERELSAERVSDILTAKGTDAPEAA